MEGGMIRCFNGDKSKLVNKLYLTSDHSILKFPIENEGFGGLCDAVGVALIPCHLNFLVIGEL